MGRAEARSGRYQVLVVGLLSLNFGILFFDRNALNFLMTFVMPDLHLDNGQVGMIAGIFSFSWALAAFAISRVSDLIGNRKLLLVVATLAFSACSFLTGIASSFAFMIGARIVMGIAEGGVMPISHAIVAAEVDPEHRGLAQGIAQNFGSNFFGSFVAPVVLVGVASHYGWRNAFFIAGVPGILSAMLIWFSVREPLALPVRAAPVDGDRGGFAGWARAIGKAMKVRNVAICVAMGVLLVAYLVICWAFMQLFLTKVRGYSQGDAAWLMGVLGLSATLGSFAIPGLSDRIGRRPVMIAMPLLALILPLGALYFSGGFVEMATLFFVGWGVNGIFPMFMATIPSESVPPAQAATVFGLCMGSCEILGGAAGPPIAGRLADSYGLSAPLWMMTGLALVAGLIAFGLTETAPRILSRRSEGTKFEPAM
jgi:ACS family hexuronate transporter-like MFS transporter